MNQFEVFYDSHCPMCRREIDMIRRKDKENQILLTDIAAADFDPASTGKTLDQLMREIHGRYPDGTLTTGVEVFREIYSRLGFGWLVVPTRWPVIGPVMDFGYRVFAKFRYASALKRFNRGHCDLPMKAFPSACKTQPDKLKSDDMKSSGMQLMPHEPTADETKAANTADAIQHG